ncbi:MAG: hypothetical protein K0Q81_119 [Paenibacillus sp.]|jgi:flagellar FliJ protein|nr:hypothetical protein [Paenibacillus sp.]
MRFRYPLQKLIDLKSNEKTQAEWGLAEAIGVLQSELSQLSGLHQNRSDVQHELSNASSNRTTVFQLMQHQDYLNYLEKQIIRKQADVESAERQVEVKQMELSEKMKEEKVWEKAKEKAFDQFSSTMQKKEQDELDEIALTRRVQTV